jgi:hypothetical protein
LRLSRKSFVAVFRQPAKNGGGRLIPVVKEQHKSTGPHGDGPCRDTPGFRPALGVRGGVNLKFEI